MESEDMTEWWVCNECAACCVGDFRGCQFKVPAGDPAVVAAAEAARAERRCQGVVEERRRDAATEEVLRRVEDLMRAVGALAGQIQGLGVIAACADCPVATDRATELARAFHEALVRHGERSGVSLSLPRAFDPASGVGRAEVAAVRELVARGLA